MFLGHNIVVYAYYLDLLNANNNSLDRVQKWRLMLKEY